MRLVTFLLPHLLVFTLYVGVSTGKTLIRTKNTIPNPVRYLKGAVHQGVVLAADEERSWQDAAETLKKSNILKNEGEFKDANAAKLESVVEKVETGDKLKAGDLAKVKWQNALAKLKEEGKLTGEQEKKVVKVAEEAAEAVKKNPKKLPYIIEVLVITFGAAIGAFIAVGIYSMISS